MSVVELLQAEVTPFSSLQEDTEAILKYFDSFSDCKILLIGDASHGTSEFYAVRAAITQHMIQNHGFNIVAVEADWPDAEAIDRYVRRRPGPQRDEIEAETQRKGREPAIMRFPTWMWRNKEVHDFVEWLRKHNKDCEGEPAGFYGLDLYSMETSMQSVIKYLDEIDEEAADNARDRYSKLIPWAEDPAKYSLEVLMTNFRGYEKEVITILKDMLGKRMEYSADGWNGVEFHSAEQNARVVADAEKYYKAMYYGRDESWNLRDTHMFETLLRILKHRGDGSKAVVWAHNSHVGDARGTSMGWSRDELNIGRLCKETFGTDALNIGCATNTGTVVAASRWGADMRIMDVMPGLRYSYEELMHSVGVRNFMLDLRNDKCHPQLRKLLSQKRLERYIGVIYKPEIERHSHYSSAILPAQFDGYIWFDETHHAEVLEAYQPEEPLGHGETWPFGL